MTNLELAKLVLQTNCREKLEEAIINMAERLDTIANMKSESPIGQLQLITKAEFFQKDCLK